MRLFEFDQNILLEYKPDITARTYGAKWLARVKNPSNPDYQWFYRNKYFYNPATKTWNDKLIIDSILSQIEESDPTFNQMTGTGGKYIPWISRQYAEGNIHRLEDIASNMPSALGRFDRYKTRKDFPQEYRDINRLNARQLIDVMDQYRPKEQDQGKFNVLFNNDNVTVLVPLDEQASRYWGSSQWCTSGESCYRFKDYSSQGQLIIVVPKNPEHPGEKYQLHFETDQFMNENDKPVSPKWLITERFPELYEYFEKNYGEHLSKLLEFNPSEEIENVYAAITNLLVEYMNSIELSENIIEKLVKVLNDKSDSETIINTAVSVTQNTGTRVTIENLSAVHVRILKYWSGVYYPENLVHFLNSVAVYSRDNEKFISKLNNIRQIPNTSYVVGTWKSGQYNL